MPIEMTKFQSKPGVHVKLFTAKSSLSPGNMTPLNSVLSHLFGGGGAHGQTMKADLFLSNSFNSQVKSLIAVMRTGGQR